MRVVTFTEPTGSDQPLFIEFVNTLHWDEGAPIELIGDQAGLAEWLVEHALPGDAQDDWLSPFWSLREHVRAITVALIGAQSLPEADLDALKRALAEPGGRFVLVDDRDGCPEVAFEAAGDDASVVTFQIALSLARFLAGGERHRLKLCANPGCGFAFLDTSTNRTRRWCDMRYCGNRRKVRAFRRRHKATDGVSVGGLPPDTRPGPVIKPKGLSRGVQIRV